MSVRGRRVPAKTDSLPAPTGGWNARDALGEMPTKDAVTLINMFPEYSQVSVRKGWVTQSTGYAGQVETLIPYSSGSANKLFAASGTAIYDATSVGAVGAAVVSGMTNARWEYINMSNAGGSFLLMVNGADYMRIYDGSAWAADQAGAYTTPNGVESFDTRTASGINLFKNRVWFIQENTLKVWYLPVDSIVGTATLFDLRSVAKKGGYLVKMENWTLDAGVGVDDHAVFLTSNGEVIVYKGTDPADATKWALVGVWEIGRPIGTRCTLKWGGDCLIITEDGIVSLGQVLLKGTMDGSAILSDKIANAVASSIVTYGSTFGWQLLYYSKQKMLMLNVPVAAGSFQEQYVMNTATKAWCRWKDVSANCWCIYQGEPYFGGNTLVGKMWSGQSDNTAQINAECKQAFTYFGSRGRQKVFGMTRPVLTVTGSPDIIVGLDMDYEDKGLTGNSVNIPVTVPVVWGTAVWGTDRWGGLEQIVKKWYATPGVGFAAAFRIRAATNGTSIKWTATDFTYQMGGVL